MKGSFRGLEKSVKWYEGVQGFLRTSGHYAYGHEVTIHFLGSACSSVGKILFIQLTIHE